MIHTLTYGPRSVKAHVHDTTEHQQKHWVGGRFYEAQRNGLLNRIWERHRGKSFVDVGASIGNHTLFFAGICQASHVLSIEPYGPSFDHLRENVELNELTNVTLVHSAIGDASGTVSVGRYGGPGNIGMVCILDPDADGAIQTEYATLDSLIQVKPDVIKIDVEHHNMPVLRGMLQTLNKYRPVVYIEAESPSQFKEVNEFLKAHGYRFTGHKFNHTPTYEFEPA